MKLSIPGLSSSEHMQKDVEIAGDAEDIFYHLVDPELRQKWGEFPYAGQLERGRTDSPTQRDTRSYYIYLSLPFLRGKYSLQEEIDIDPKALRFESQFSLHGDESGVGVELAGQLEPHSSVEGIAVASFSIALHGAIRVCRSRLERAIDKKMPDYVEAIEEQTTQNNSTTKAS